MPRLSRSLLLCSLLACVAATQGYVVTTAAAPAAGLGHTDSAAAPVEAAEATATAATARSQTENVAPAVAAAPAAVLGHAEATAATVEAAEATATIAAVWGQTENAAPAVATTLRGHTGATAKATLATARATHAQRNATSSAAVEAATTTAAAQGHTEATSVLITGIILSSASGADQHISSKMPPTSKQREDFTPTTFTAGAIITKPTVLSKHQMSEGIDVRPHSTAADVLQTYVTNSADNEGTLLKSSGGFSSAASTTTEAANPLGMNLISKAIVNGHRTWTNHASTPPPLLTVRNANVSTATRGPAAVWPSSPAATTHESEKTHPSTLYPPTKVVDVIRGRTTTFGEATTQYSKSEQNPTLTITTRSPIVTEPPMTSAETEATSGSALLLHNTTRTPDNRESYKFTTTAAATESKVNSEKTAFPVVTTVQYTNHSHSYNKTVTRAEKSETTSIASIDKEPFVTHGPLDSLTDTTPPPQRTKDVDPTSVANPTAAMDTSVVPQTSQEMGTESHGTTSAAFTSTSSHENVSQPTTDNSSLSSRVTSEVQETASNISCHSTTVLTPIAPTTKAEGRSTDGTTSVPSFHRETAGSTWSSYLTRTAATDSTAKSMTSQVATSQVATSQVASTLVADETSSSQVLSSSTLTQIIPTYTTLGHTTKIVPTLGTTKVPQTTPGEVNSSATSAKFFSSEPGVSSRSSEMTAIISTATAPLTRPVNNSTAPPTQFSMSTSPDPCSQHNCKNGGTCHKNNGSVTCQCKDGWSGMDCNRDVDECSESPCPLSASCSNAPGSYACTCPRGYDVSAAGYCAQVKVFPGIMRSRKTLFERDFNNETSLLNKRTLLQLVNVLNESLKDLRHFVKSVINNTRVSGDTVHVASIFHAYSSITHDDVAKRINGFVNGCKSRNDTSACSLVTGYGLSYEAGSLCDGDACDVATSDCVDPGGFVRCTCKAGYFKFKDTDRTCRDCGSGYFLQTDGRCTRCPHGFGGFNCDDPSLLVMVAMAITLCFLFLTMVWMVKKACGRRRARARRLVPSGVQLSPYADLPPPAHRARPRCGSAGSRVKLTLQQQLSTTSSERASEGWRYSDMEMYRMSKLGRYNLSYIGDEAGIRDYF